MDVKLSQDDEGRLVYKPDGETLRLFLADNSHVSVIRGPIGSGTSTACCIRIWRHAMEQRTGSDGIKRSRWAIVRNSYPDLKNTTVKTWLDWFPEERYGRFNWGKPMSHVLRAGNVELEVIFLALDQEDDVRKLRSFEFTGIWFNELEYIEKAIFDEGESRTGRFPAKKDGGATWHGVIADMNAPNEDHWQPMMVGEAPYPDEMPEEKRYRWPKHWSYFVQPPALIEEFAADGKTITGYKENPGADNRRWLEDGYYLEKAEGKAKAWIDSRLMNRITFYVEGDRVWPMFRVETHVAPQPLVPVEGHTVYVGLDFGRRPAAVFCQEIGNRIFVQFECRGYGMSSATFVPQILKPFIARHYPSFALSQFQFWGDPKGRDKGQADENTSYEIFAAHGITVRPAPVKNNHIQTRLSAVENWLNDMHMGLPRFVLSPACTTLKAAMAGKYQLKKVDGELVPVKDKYSDIADALQYDALGMGEGLRMVGRDPGHRPIAMMLAQRGRSLRRVSA
jgi:hypothetical protein